jgi:hypothetical protein
VNQVVSPKAHHPLFRALTFDSIELTDNPRGSPIQGLNDELLLNIIYLYRLHIEGEEYGENTRINWDRQRWWYKLAQVSRKWRHLILSFPIRLDIHLLCTYGVPIADMLAHSPPLPLAICYSNDDHEMTAEDEEGALLALSHRDRVHRIALWMPAQNLCKFIAAMDEEYPILEHICIGSRPRGSTSPSFPETFQAPNLRHVWTTCHPIGSPLLTTTMGLVKLELSDIPPSPWFSPTYILPRLSLMPHLEILRIHFYTPHPNRDVEPSTLPHVTLPNLLIFSFRGVSGYLEGLARIRAPRLSIFDVQFFNQLTFSVPRLLQFLQAPESPGFSTVEVGFVKDFVGLIAAPNRSSRPYRLRLQIMCKDFDWQVASAVQILDTLSPVLSGVDNLALIHLAHNRLSELPDEVDRTQWRKLFRPFSNVKALSVPESLSGRISRSLRSEDGEMPLELLPNLRFLRHPDGGGYGNIYGNIFASFINERRAAGHRVDLLPQWIQSVADFPLPHLAHVFSQWARSVSEGEKTLHALGEPDPQRRAKLDNQKQIMLRIRELINVRTSMIPLLPEDKYIAFSANFARTAGIRATKRDFTIEGLPINPWLLHRAVFSRGGFDSVRV